MAVSSLRRYIAEWRECLVEQIFGPVVIMLMVLILLIAYPQLSLILI